MRHKQIFMPVNIIYIGTHTPFCHSCRPHCDKLITLSHTHTQLDHQSISCTHTHKHMHIFNICHSQARDTRFHPPCHLLITAFLP